MARPPRALVLGTAGHIDHGKTTLVRALTGVDTDRLPEEKRRGITIELGFAAWELAPGLSVSIVDVPGHEAFVRTMVAGAGGIDAVLLVVSAEEGVMPQTREHLHVCQLLGLRHGVVALTKLDRLGGDPEAAQLAADDVRAALLELAPGLAELPIIPCSALTGEGLPALTSAIRRVAAAAPARPLRDRPIVPIDRVFAVKGHGTVATGTLLTGRLDLTGDRTLQLIPTGPLRSPRELRARALHVRGAACEQAPAGSRVALNLGNVATDELTRGDVISSGPRVTRGQVCLALLEHLPHDDLPWRSGTTIEVCAGTAHTTARLDPLGPLLTSPPDPAPPHPSPDLPAPTTPSAPRNLSRKTSSKHLSQETSPTSPTRTNNSAPHPSPTNNLANTTPGPTNNLSPKTSQLDLSQEPSDLSQEPSDLSPEPSRPARATVPPGATALVRLRLDAPLPLWHGQRLIVRRAGTGETTRRHGHTVGGGLVLDPTPSSGRGQRPRWLALARALAHPEPATRVRALLRDAGALGIDRDALERRAGPTDLEPVLKDIRESGDALTLGEQRWVDAAVLAPLAVAAAELVTRFHAEHPLQPGLGRAAAIGGLPGRVAPDVAAAAVAHAVTCGLLRADGDLLTRIADASIDPGLPPKVQAVLDLFRRAGIAPPTLREVQDQVGLGERQALEALGALQRTGAIVRVSPDLSLAREHHESLIARARAHLREHGKLDVQALKTLTGLSRKFVVPFLEHLDRLQISRRQGDLRVPGPRL